MYPIFEEKANQLICFKKSNIILQGEIIMLHFIQSLIGTFSVIFLAMYDFLCICRILKKEELAEPIWKYLLPDKPYNKMLLFVVIRPMFLQVSFILFILSGGIFIRLPLFKLLLLSAPLFALGGLLTDYKRK